MGSHKPQEDGSEARRDTGRAGNSGEGSDSVLRLIRSRRIAQFRETAIDPDDKRQDEPEEDDRS